MDLRGILNRRAERLRRHAGRISNLRGAVFFGTIGLAAVFARSGLAGGAILGTGASLFTLLVLESLRAEARAARYFARLRLLDQDEARLRLDWGKLPPLPLDEERRLALPASFGDLDLVGPASLLRLLNSTASEQGLGRLLELFDPSLEGGPAIVARRQCVRELEPLRLLRTRFRLAAELGSDRRLNSGALADLASQPAHEPGAGRWTALLLALQLASHAALAWYLLRQGTPWFLAGWAAVFLAFRVGESRFHEPFERALSLELHLAKFMRLSTVLEAHRPARGGAALAELLRPFHGDEPPSRLLSGVRLWVGLLSARGNPAVHFLLNLAVPWDFWITLRLERTRRGLAAALPGWVDAMARFEALSSLALFGELFRAQTEDPRFLPGAARLAARGLGHPLLAEAGRVRNDVVLDEARPCILITGSNMSGKSTWLRTIGVNALLARAGARVVARDFEFGDLRVESSLRKRDSLADEVSTFYAEVRRLREVLDAVKGRGATVLYLIDEIFQGTNNRERLIGSRSYIESLLEGRALGLIATHDLELADLQQAYPQLRNQHFRETIAESEGGQALMSFSYELRDGPCPSTNALRIMRLAGLPVRA